MGVTGRKKKKKNFNRQIVVEKYLTELTEAEKNEL